MKKTILLIAALVVSTGAMAQNYILVDSEKVFKSIAAYNTAISTIDTEAEKYQAQVDEKFTAVEKLFNDYQAGKATMTAAQRQSAEQNIVSSEQAATKFQEDIFGEEGVVAKRREALLTPYQDKVKKAIETYAKAQRVDIVLDVNSNPSVLYHNPAADRTDAIINLVK